MTEKYRLMIYFAHTTLCIYSKTIKCEREMSQYSDTTKEIMKNSPKLFNEMLKEMEMNVKMLKKQFKEMNLK